MEYGKLDAGLRLSMTRHEHNPGHRYTVFIHTTQPVGEQEIRFMQDIGLGAIKPGRTIIAADLPAESIAVLSDQIWVSAIRLSRKLKPAGDPRDSP